MQRCSQFSVKIWDAYLHSVINEQQTQMINAHLLTCSGCNRILNALETENALIGIGLRSVPLQRMSIPAAELVALHTSRDVGETTCVPVCATERPSWRMRISSLLASLTK